MVYLRLNKNLKKSQIISSILSFLCIFAENFNPTKSILLESLLIN